MQTFKKMKGTKRWENTVRRGFNAPAMMAEIELRIITAISSFVAYAIMVPFPTSLDSPFDCRSSTRRSISSSIISFPCCPKFTPAWSCATLDPDWAFAAFSEFELTAVRCQRQRHEAQVLHYLKAIGHCTHPFL
jgi:hypothetical protein